MEDLKPLEAITNDGEVKETDLVAKPTMHLSMQFMQNIDKLQESIDRGEFIEGVSLKREYYEFTEKGKIVFGVLLGFETIHKKEADGTLKPIESACFLNIMDKRAYLVGGVDIIQQLRSLPIESAFKCTYLGNKKVATGNMKEFLVVPIIIN